MAANPQDGTALGTGEVISNEQIDPQVGGRRDANQPPTGYKLPRSKLAVGPYGQDFGDASPDFPLAAESLQQRQLAEMDSLRSREQAGRAQSRYASETVSLIDARGSAYSTRGSR